MKRKFFLYIVSTVFIIMHLNGCTMIGFIKGTAKDKKNACLKPPIYPAVEKVTPGTPLKITLTDNRVVHGTLQGIERVDSTEYTRRYADFLNQGQRDLFLPQLHDTISLSRKSGFRTVMDKSKYLFSGFDFNSICLRPLSEGDIKLENLDSLHILMDQHGKQIPAQDIRGYVEAGLVPLQSELLLQSPAGTQKIPVENVSMINLPPKKNGRIKGALIGLALDAVAIAILSSIELFKFELEWGSTQSW